MKNILQSYRTYIHSLLNMPDDAGHSLNFWQQQLFYNFLVYCLPVSLTALIPGIYIGFSLRLKQIAMVSFDCFCFAGFATFFPGLSLFARKAIIVTTLYF